MAVTISYKNSKISEINNSNTRTLETAGKYCESNIIVNYNKEGNKIVEGNSSIVITDAEEGDICALTQYGVCEQDSSTNAISCNNGVLSISSGEIITTGTNETVTIGSQIATIENLYSVGNIKDEQEIVTGRVTRKNDICIYDGTQSVGDRYISSTGAKDNGAIIIYPREEEYTNENVVSFSKNTEEDINSLEVSMSPIQSLNGYSKPWPAGGGANKFGVSDASNISSGTNKTLSISDGLMTITATGAVSSTVIAGQSALENVIMNSTLSAGTYYFKIFDFSSTVTGATADGIKLRIETNGTNTDYARDTAFTLSADSTIVGFYVASALQWNSGNTMKLRVAISATNVDAWTPYSNICPISGRTGLNVWRTGKNLADPSEMLTGYFVRAGNTSESNPLGSLTANNGWECTGYIPVKPNTSYTQILPTYAGAAAAGLVCYADKSVASAISGVPTSTQRSDTYSFTTPANCHYVRFSWSITLPPSPDYPLPQFEQGSTATTYERYRGNTYSVDWSTQAGTVYGGTLDVVTGVLTVTHKILDLGTKSWLKSGSLYYSEDSAFDGAHDPNGEYLLCSQYKGGDAYGGNVNNTIDTRVGTYKRIWIRDNSKSGYTSAQFKAAMDGVQLVYLLATPLTYQLTPQEIQTLVGQNNIFSPDATSIKVAVSNPRIDQVTPQPLTLVEGNNTITATNLNVSSAQLKLEYIANGDNLFYGSNTSNYVNAGAADYMII